MKKTIVLFVLTLAILCGLLIFLGARLSGKQNGDTAGQVQDTAGQVQDTAGETVSPPITATLAVCGDIMSHLPQTNDAYDSSTDSYSYLPCFQYIRPWIAAADFAAANFETTLNGPPYSGYPQFCAPDALASDLKTIGFDLVTTANNHCMDKGFAGLSQSLDVLDSAGLKHVGTYRTQAEFDQNQGVVMADVGGISVAFLGYSYGTNGIGISEEHNFCLNRFNVDYNTGCVTLDKEKLTRELAYAKTLHTDLIAVMIHWGIEYQIMENQYQDQVADFLIQNGADVILGSHSHVPQPMMTRTVTLDDGSTRSGFVCYSLGNFVSNQSPTTVGVNYTDTTAILNLELTKNFETGQTTVSKISYVPLLVLNRGAGAANQYAILDVHTAMASYEAGDTSLISSALYQKLQYALEGCHKILGAEYDSTAPVPIAGGSGATAGDNAA